MTSIFISYRRRDSLYQADKIYERLRRALPSDKVFMDVDSIPPGVDFVAFLEGKVRECEVLLALMGASWASAVDPATNARRLDDPGDFVRIEIAAALVRDIRVVPVLLDGATMPLEHQLPDELKPLVRRNGEFIEHRTFDTDVDRLVRRLGLETSADAGSPAHRPHIIPSIIDPREIWTTLKARGSLPRMRAFVADVADPALRHLFEDELDELEAAAARRSSNSTFKTAGGGAKARPSGASASMHTEMIDDLRSEFIIEAQESVQVSEAAVNKLTSNPSDEFAINDIMRLMHTIKGACGFLLLPRLEAITHAAETLLGRARDRELSLTPETARLIALTFNRVRTLVSDLERDQAEPTGDDNDLIERLEAAAGVETVDPANSYPRES